MRKLGLLERVDEKLSGNGCGNQGSEGEEGGRAVLLVGEESERE